MCAWKENCADFEQKAKIDKDIEKQQEGQYCQAKEKERRYRQTRKREETIGW